MSKCLCECVMCVSVFVYEYFFCLFLYESVPLCQYVCFLCAFVILMCLFGFVCEWGGGLTCA